MSETTSASSLLPNFNEIQLPKPGMEERTTKPVDGKPRKVTRYWLNVGILRAGKLISAPMGIPLDDLKPLPVPSASSKASPEFRALRATQAKFWESFSDFFHGLKPGESVILTHGASQDSFVCEVRMTENKELTEQEEEVNPFDISNLTFGPKKTEEKKA